MRSSLSSNGVPAKSLTAFGPKARAGEETRAIGASSGRPEFFYFNPL
jgi:hypothetical protein